MKRIIVTISEPPPREFESVEELQQYVDRIRSERKPPTVADWVKALPRLDYITTPKRGKKGSK